MIIREKPVSLQKSFRIDNGDLDHYKTSCEKMCCVTVHDHKADAFLFGAPELHSFGRSDICFKLLGTSPGNGIPALYNLARFFLVIKCNYETKLFTN